MEGLEMQAKYTYSIIGGGERLIINRLLGGGL